MAEREFYRLDLVVGTKGTEETKRELRTMDRFIEQTRKRGELLNRMKVSPTISLIDRISGTLKTVERNLNRLNTVKKVTIEAVDRTTNVVRRITSALTSPLAMLGAGAGMAGLIGYPMKLASEMEQANIAMETMLGSSEKAHQFLSGLADFAMKTPFEMPQLLDASRRLLAFGFSAESVIPTLTAVGDAASGLGLGVEGINRITLALGQMRAKAKVSGEEMLQLTEAGIPAWDILAKAMGKSTAEVMKMSEKGLIPANKAIDALIKGMEERFPNMMDRQSRSLFGLLSNIKDYANLKFFWAFGEGIRQAAVPALQKFTDMLSDNEKGLKRVQNYLMELGRTVGTWVVGKIEAFYRWFEKLSSDEMFNKMSFGDKLIYVINQGLDVVSNWLDGHGGKKVQEIFIKLGELAAKAWLTALSGMAKGAVSSIAHGNIMGGIGLLAVAGMLGGGMLLRGAWGLGKGIFSVGKWATGRLGRGALAAKAVTGAAETAATTTKQAGLLSRLSGTGRLLGRIAVPLGVGLDLFSIFRTEPEERETKIGGAVGRWGGMFAGAKLGAAAGAAIGSIVPGVGTAAGAGVGGFLGGLGGYFSGGAIGEEIGRNWEKIKSKAKEAWESIKQKAGDVLGWISTHMTFESLVKGAGFAFGYLEETIFDGEWWNQKWEAVKTWTNNAWSGMVGVWNDTKKALSETLFSGDWWYAKWEAVKTWTSNAWENSVSIWEGIKTTISNTLFSGKWWADKWNYVKSLGSDTLGYVKNKRDEIIGVFNAGRAEGRNAAKGASAPDYNALRTLKGYASGGILTRPHVGMVAEKGPEVIIPLSSRLRSRALDLWRQTGEYLGVKPYADGGFVGAFPSAAGTGGGGGISVTVSGLTINLLASEIDEENLALRVGRVIVGEIKKALDNRT